MSELAVLPKLEPKIEEKDKGRDLIIIGGGPAGLTAGLYASRARLNTLLFEKALLGGQASTADLIENYPGFPLGVSGLEFSRRLEDQARRLGLEIAWSQVSGIKIEGDKKIVETDGKSFSSRVLILAMGVEPKKLGIPGENEFRGRGVSYCATCDGPFYKDKKVIIAGGGNAAIEEALFLSRYASNIAVVHRREKLRADKILQERAMANPKIYFIWHSTVDEIIGKDRVQAVVIRDVLSDKKSRVQADGVFIYVGSEPNTDFLRGIIKLSEDGYIITDEEMKTSAEGIFAAGDIRKKLLRQIVTASADGAMAVESVLKFLGVR